MRILKTIGIVGSTAALLIAAPIAFAEGQSTTDQVDPAIRPEKVRPIEAPKVRAELRETKELKDRAPEMGRLEKKAGFANASTTQNIKERAEAAKERMEAAREEAKKRVEAQREKAEQRVSEIKDRAVQQRAHTISKQFANINKRWTDHFMDLLDRYDAILKKVEDRAAIAASSGKNTASTTPAIQAARTAIDSARTAVIAQAAKVYELNTSTSTAITAPVTASTTTATSTNGGQAALIQNLRSAFKTLHEQLFKDLFALRDGPMLNARKAVQTAVQSLVRIPGINDDTATTTPPTTATSTATTTNQ